MSSLLPSRKLLTKLHDPSSQLSKPSRQQNSSTQIDINKLAPVEQYSTRMLVSLSRHHAVLLSAALSSVFGQHELFCPNEDDFTGDSVFSTDPSTGTSGWTLTGPSGVHGKQTFNLLNQGWVEFEIDTTHAQLGVNNNFYTSSPEPSVFPNYCDIQTNDSPTCMEMDIMENNGNCMSQVTWHTWANKNGDCDQGGCAGQKYASGVRMVRAEFSKGGWMTTWYNGKKVEVVDPAPSENATDFVADQMSKYGLQFHSTQWKGWVPGMGPKFGGYDSWGWQAGNHECWSEAASKADVHASVVTIRKLKVYGTVVQGPKPNKCPEDTSGQPVWRSEEPDMVGPRSEWLGPTKKWKELQAAAHLQSAGDEVAVVVPEGAGPIGKNLLLARAPKEEAPNKDQAV